MKAVALVGSAVVLGGGAFYARSYLANPLPVVTKCRDWYEMSFTAWSKWKTLPADKKAELQSIETNIDVTITNACKCLYERSEIFREQILPKHGVAKTDSYIGLEVAEAKKFQLECNIPAFFTWAKPEDAGAKSP